MAHDYINIHQIADDLYDHPLLKNVPFERIVNHAVEFMKKLGYPQIFDEKVAHIRIDNHRGKLPCDYYNVIQVKESRHNITFTASNDSFHYTATGAGPLTYKLQAGYIFTSLKDGDIEMSYNAIPVDSEGFPLIMDNSAYCDALKLYIRKRVFSTLFDQGKISYNVLSNAQQEYYAAVHEAQNDINTPTVDEMENLVTMWTRLLPKRHLHASGFIDEGFKEHRKF